MLPSAWKEKQMHFRLDSRSAPERSTYGEIFQIREIFVQKNADSVVLLQFVAIQNCPHEHLHVYHGLLIVLAAHLLKMDGQKVRLLFSYFLRTRRVEN